MSESTKRNARRAPGEIVETGLQASANPTEVFAPAQPFVVQTKKASGKFFEYGRYGNEAEARNVCRLLAWAGAVARVIREWP
jgi:hypothetical protein